MNGADDLTLRLNRTHFPVTALGPGVRLGVWLQGCPLACAGCMTQDTWDADGGVLVAVDEVVERWRCALARGATGLTVSGGEPLTQAGPLRAFLTAVRRVNAREQPEEEPDILLYTGFEPEELDADQRAAAGLADVLVTGRYRAAQPTRLIWRGSENQRLRPQTALGAQRYREYVHARPERVPLQYRLDAGSLLLIGVPRPGTLTRLGRVLGDTGLMAGRPSWRPRGAARDAGE